MYARLQRAGGCLERAGACLERAGGQCERFDVDILWVVGLQNKRCQGYAPRLGKIEVDATKISGLRP